MRLRTAAAIAAAAGMLTAGGAGAGKAAASTRPLARSSAAFHPLTASRINLVRRSSRLRVYTACGAKAVAKGLACYSPQVLQAAYGVSPLLAGSVDGRGETVVLPEQAFPQVLVHRLPAHDGAYLRESVTAFDTIFHLPAARLRVDTALAGGSPADRVPGPEEILDVEMVHAMAPGARIVVDPISGNPTRRLPAIIRLGARQGKLISLSYGIGESCLRRQLPAIQAALTAAQARGVSVFAASGDELDMSRTCTTGATNGVRSLTMPGSDPLVTSVGGTQLSVAPTSGAYAAETAWNQQASDGGHGKPAGTGGGFSDLFTTPGYQVGVPGIGAQRGVPDVAFSASETDGVEIAEYAEGETCALGNVSPSAARRLRCVVLAGVGGTSVGAPAWAGIGALADQYAHHPLGLLNPAIYAIGKSAQYAQAFHDVTTGDNSAVFKGTAISGFSAAAGWDPVTGWGSPNASVLVPLLAQGG